MILKTTKTQTHIKGSTYEQSLHDEIMKKFLQLELHAYEHELAFWLIQNHYQAVLKLTPQSKRVINFFSALRLQELISHFVCLQEA